MCPARPAHAPAGRRTFPASVVGMRSTMQEIPLNVARILEYGRTIHANTKVTSWGPDGPETQTFADVGARAAALAHALRDELGMITYFADPYASWQRASCEDRNGMIRRYLPKRCTITMDMAREVQEIVDETDNRPMRVLGYRTPAEAFIDELLHLQT